MERQIRLYDTTLAQTPLKGAIQPRAKHGVLWPASVRGTKNRVIVKSTL